MPHHGELQLQAQRQARANLLSRVRTLRSELYRRTESIKALRSEALALRDDIETLKHLANLPEDLHPTATQAEEFFSIWEGRKDDTRDLLLTLYRILELELEGVDN